MAHQESWLEAVPDIFANPGNHENGDLPTSRKNDSCNLRMTKIVYVCSLWQILGAIPDPQQNLDAPDVQPLFRMLVGSTRPKNGRL